MSHRTLDLQGVFNKISLQVAEISVNGQLLFLIGQIIINGYRDQHSGNYDEEFDKQLSDIQRT